MQQNNIEKDICFVLITDDEHPDIWTKVLEPAINKHNMISIRESHIKEKFENTVLSIRDQIFKAKLIIAILNSDNSSIMYQLGLAHATKKHIIIMLENLKEINPFFSQLNLLRYDPADLTGTLIALNDKIKLFNNAKTDDPFPHLPSFEVYCQEIKELNYFRQKSKALTLNITPKNCSIFFNNNLLKQNRSEKYNNPTIYINKHTKNVISIFATQYFEHHQIITENELSNSKLDIKLDKIDTSTYPRRVNHWLALRREDPDNPVLSFAIGRYLSDESTLSKLDKDSKQDMIEKKFCLESAKKEAQFCINKAPEWFGGYTLLGIVEDAEENHEEAIKCFEKVEQMIPDNFLPYYDMACSLSLLNKCEESFSMLEKIIMHEDRCESLREIYRHQNRPYRFEEDNDFKNIMLNDKYKRHFEEKILKLIYIIESDPASLIKNASPDHIQDSYQNIKLPLAVKGFHIKNFLCINDLKLSGIPIDSPWIFLIGDNAIGKTTLLQALAIGLSGEKHDSKDLLTNHDTIIDIDLKINNENKVRHFYNTSKEWYLKSVDNDGALNEPLESLFVLGYGPSRLEIQADESYEKLKKASGSLYGLFNQTGILHNIFPFLKDLKMDADDTDKSDITQDQRKYIKETIKTIINLLVKMMPNVIEIKFDGSHVKFINENTDVKIEELSAGNKSIAGMIGDMLIRFYQFEAEQSEFSQIRSHQFDSKALKGVVFIEELELHLHPSWQRELPRLLSDTFPNIQFIASTHSPIPILGAPPGSTFIKVTGTAEHGTKADILDINIDNLLPNSVLTSPIFDMKSILSVNNKEFSDVRTEDDFAEIKKRDKIYEELSNLVENISTQ